MERTVVSLLGVERGNGTTLSRTYNMSKIDTVPVSTVLVLVIIMQILALSDLQLERPNTNFNY